MELLGLGLGGVAVESCGVGEGGIQEEAQQQP